MRKTSRADATGDGDGHLLASQEVPDEAQQRTGGSEKVPRLRLCGELEFREKIQKKRRRDLAAAVTTENTNQMLCCQLCLVIIDRVGSIWMECLWICLISQFSLSRSLSSSALPFAVL